MAAVAEFVGRLEEPRIGRRFDPQDHDAELSKSGDAPERLSSVAGCCKLPFHNIVSERHISDLPRH